MPGSLAFMMWHYHSAERGERPRKGSRRVPRLLSESHAVEQAPCWSTNH
jgi:hypothetical protein